MVRTLHQVRPPAFRQPRSVSVAPPRTVPTIRPEVEGVARMFSAVGITLVDFKIEFGRVWENDFSRVLLADEISPDSCRLWDASTGEKLDKDRFRHELGNVIESYTEVARRLGIMKGMPTVIQGGLH